MPTVDDDLDDKFAPVTREDVTDEKLVVGEFRAFRNETRDALGSIAGSLNKLTSIDDKLDVIIDWQADMESRVVRVEARQDANDAAVAEIKERLAALETPKPKRATKGPRKK